MSEFAWNKNPINALRPSKDSTEPTVRDHARWMDSTKSSMKVVGARWIVKAYYKYIALNEPVPMLVHPLQLGPDGMVMGGYDSFVFK